MPIWCSSREEGQGPPPWMCGYSSGGGGAHTAMGGVPMWAHGAARGGDSISAAHSPVAHASPGPAYSTYSP